MYYLNSINIYLDIYTIKIIHIAQLKDIEIT
jgi:hypothetical protein